MNFSSDSEGGWLRLWRNGPGLWWTRADPYFSERYGYTRAFLVIRRWRFFILRAAMKEQGQ